MRVIIWQILITAAALACDLSPQPVRQGEVIRLTCDSDAASARLLERTYPLFPLAGGKVTGLLPVPAGANPGTHSITVLTHDERTWRTLRVQIKDAQFLEENLRLSKSTAQLRPAPGETERLQTFRQLVSPERFWSEPFQAPVPGCMTSPFGVKRMHNRKPTGNYHGGVDQRSPAGRPIHAAAAGIVRLADKFTLPGNAVGIDHGQGLTSMYMHMSKIAVAEGERVDAGDVIGYVGSTGRSNAPHLHWGIAAHAVSVNPQQWVRLKSCSAAKQKARKPR